MNQINHNIPIIIYICLQVTFFSLDLPITVRVVIIVVQEKLRAY